jgi:ABC-type amino acid transport system permease subunit
MADGTAMTLLISMVGITVTSLIGALAYLAKRKLESIESNIEQVYEKVEDRERKTNREHQVVVSWLSRLTEAINNDGAEVDKPDEVTESLDFEED